MAERLFRLLNIVDSWLFPEKITCLCCDSALADCMRSDASVSGKRILLVDDVLTTGSTASEAARALLAAGACRVSLVTAAKTIPESGDPLFVPARDIPSFVQDDAP